MAGPAHAIPCPKCNSTLFREEKIVELDSSVVIREDLPVPARTIQVQYRYICLECGNPLHHEWTHENAAG
ncbi:hypothetical protein [Alicyclobacillus sp. SP_1]|jgi:DNA-directed RNA polymerase subunit RPC12/RpoP|uniref:hypothetical protein n=1 Tax=Alicyclobacillus sp. SP_1 TaxID=2942475 RepID=UPI0021583B9E|nr:hypothetical protein [Alicyclobacillus sp. SP_1]